MKQDTSGNNTWSHWQYEMKQKGNTNFYARTCLAADMLHEL